MRLVPSNKTWWRPDIYSTIALRTLILSEGFINALMLGILHLYTPNSSNAITNHVKMFGYHSLPALV